ncbi:hypothetical protein [Halorubrum sp. N11]|uniref:hypothetical protein n=1 Tax=Halorubrum sp. N11 TaxID=3402276 RepID=UPI003EB82BE1
MTDERDRGDTGDDRVDSNRDPDVAAPDDPDSPDDTPDTPTGPMTDIATDTDDATETNHAPRTTDPASDAGRDTNGSDGRFGRLSTDALRGLIDRIGLAALILLALIAGWGFYSQAGRAIRTWLDPAYQPIALAAFNLAVLLVALAGVAHQLYRIRRSERSDGEAGE